MLAVADGIVFYVKEGVPENKPSISGKTNPPKPLTRETWPGNQVCIDLGNGRYAWYAHLLVGSVRFKLGEKVKKGQVIGLIGNSGNAAGPHLHFQVGDGGKGLNACDGLPLVFESFDLLWRVTARSKEQPANTKPKRHRLQIPLNDSIVRF